jgi:hypothetical protein
VFRTGLSNSVPRIKRGAYLTEVRLSPVARGQFSMTGKWVDKNGKAGSHTKVFTRGDVFNNTGPAGFRFKKKRCRHADDFIREVLRVRGVIT